MLLHALWWHPKDGWHPLCREELIALLPAWHVRLYSLLRLPLMLARWLLRLLLLCFLQVCLQPTDLGGRCRARADLLLQQWKVVITSAYRSCVASCVELRWMPVLQQCFAELSDLHLHSCILHNIVSTSHMPHASLAVCMLLSSCCRQCCHSGKSSWRCVPLRHLGAERNSAASCHACMSHPIFQSMCCRTACVLAQKYLAGLSPHCTAPCACSAWQTILFKLVQVWCYIRGWGRQQSTASLRQPDKVQLLQHQYTYVRCGVCNKSRQDWYQCYQTVMR